MDKGALDHVIERPRHAHQGNLCAPFDHLHDDLLIPRLAKRG